MMPDSPILGMLYRIKVVLLTGAALLLPAVTAAQSMFDTYFLDTGKTSEAIYPSKDAMGFIIQEMKRWNGHGILLTAQDIKDAVDDQREKLCTKKTDRNGNPIEFIHGGDAAIGGSCVGLETAILSLVRNERESEDLSFALLSAAQGSELSVADEVNQALNVGTTAQLIRRLWSGTKAAIIPWDPNVDGDVRSLASAIQSEEDPARVIHRFRNGIFREKIEGSPFADSGDIVQSALFTIADKLRITGDTTTTGEYPSQVLPGLPGVMLWARSDDLGLTWLIPEPLPPRMWSMQNGQKIYARDGSYPTVAKGAELTAYPFLQPAPENSLPSSPLCSRTTARFGYLCAPLPETNPACSDPSDPGAITLLICATETHVSELGPDECDALKLLFKDEGKPLVDPSAPGQVDPTLPKADTKTICTPENRVLYQDELAAHACYVALCLRQSEDTNALVPGRNPTLINESISPYLACMRDDPKLGTSIEAAKENPVTLPPYIGHQLVRDFEQAYCRIANSAPHPVLGFCAERDDDRTQTPAPEPMGHESTLLEEAREVRETREEFLNLSTAIGQRAAVDQSLNVHRKLFTSLASFIRQVANLFLELKKAPLTDNACPWTGPPIDYSS